MKAVLRTLCAIVMMSGFSAYAEVSADDFSIASVEKTYVKCTMNGKGERVPNYYVVVNGVAHQTDSRTFFEIKKARNEEKKNFANRQQNISVDKEDKSNKEINTMVLVTMLDNKLITVESAKELVNTNKIIVEDKSILDEYEDDNTFYDKLKEKYYGE